MENRFTRKINLDIKLYTKRWFLLALFMAFLSNVAMHWMQFASLTNVMSRYYGVHPMFVEWTATIILAARAFLLFPALFLIDKLGTRNTLVLSTTLGLTAACVKALAIAPDRFYLAMTGQAFSAFSLVFTYSLVGRFSAAWFSSNEISTAGAFGCVGDQMGAAFSYLLPTLFIPDSLDDEEVEKGMRHLNYLYIASSVVILLLILMFFKSDPKRPPSAAQAHKRSNEDQRVLKCVKKNLTNGSFLLFALSHGYLLGSFSNAYGTLLNGIIVSNFPGYAKHTGTIGFMNIISGMAGSLIVSYILDKTRKFKGNCITLAVANSICLGLCGVAMKMGDITYVYVVYTISGFFLYAYYATGLQMGIELTYPIPEGITVATMSTIIELWSIVLTGAFGFAVRRFGDFKSTMGMTILLSLSAIAVCLVPPKFKREAVERAAKAAEGKTLLSDSKKKTTITTSTSAA